MRGLLLGFDGVLVDDRQTHIELLCRVLGEEGLEVSPASAAQFLVGGESALELDRGLLKGALEAAGEPVAPARVSRLAARKAAYYQMRLRSEGHRAVEGGVALVKRLSEAGWMLSLVTPAPRGEVEPALEQLGLTRHFKSIVAGGSEGAGTPEGFLHAFRDLNALPPLPTRLLHPHEVATLDAAPSQLEAAAAAGFMTVAVTGHWPAQQLAAAADRVVDGLEGLDARRLGELLRGE